MKSCKLCKLNSSGQAVGESKCWHIDEPRDFKFVGLYFIRLKRHCESLAELTDAESEEIGVLIKKYSGKSYKESKASRVLAMSLGLSDPHIHFWILPKTSQNQEKVLLIRRAMRSILDIYKT